MTLVGAAPSEWPQIRRSKVHELVAGELENMIARGVFPQGEPMPSERELAERLGVGRPAVRQALARLQQIGIVEVRNGERAKVTRPTTKSVIGGLDDAVRHLLAQGEMAAEFRDVRVFFEVGLARHAAENATPDQIERMRRVLDENRAAIGNRDAFRGSDIAFHYEIARVTGNSIITDLYRAARAWLSAQRSAAYIDAKHDAKAFAAHQAIFDAIAGRRPEQAAAAMKRHLHDVGAQQRQQDRGDARARDSIGNGGLERQEAGH